MKTNKSFSKRIKVTGKGKALVRKPGQNHFNAKERRVESLNKKKVKQFQSRGKNLTRLMPKKGLR